MDFSIRIVMMENIITIKKFKSEPYAYNVGAMHPYMNYTPRTFKEIQKGVVEFGYL